jgi:dihydropteroate synthase
MRWRCGQYEFLFPRPALVMGIVNVTPDSFSDGGQFRETEAAVRHGEQLVAEGADLLDIGGESTRPASAPVAEADELARVLPVIERLVARVKVPLSIDTMKPGVARAALAAGASLVNDVAANRKSSAIWEVVAASGAGYVAMHMQGTPQTMQLAPHYTDVVGEVREFFADQLRCLNEAGIDSEQVVLDPGIGFGKALPHNLDLLTRLAELGSLARPLLLGVSRKSFIGKLLGLELSDRVAAGIACSVWAASAGVQIFRTHDVASTVQGLRMLEALAQHQPKTV